MLGVLRHQTPAAPDEPAAAVATSASDGLYGRDSLNHVIVLSESHLRRILRGYVDYYSGVRPHDSLDGNSPLGREVEPPSKGPVVAIPQVGGLHHRYTRAA